jgi:peptidoglycan hydrolase-like protein with peptidoglycan-binding domain
MNFRICVAAGAALLAPLPAIGTGSFNTNRVADARGWRTPLQDIATVQAVQRALRAEGYDPGPADGTLNAKTVQALKQAQQARELEPTGQVDRRTAAALGVNPGSARSRPDTGFVLRPRGG